LTAYEARIEVGHRPGILDPQGGVIERALPALGYANVSHVRVGKSIRLAVEAPDEDSARVQVHADLWADLLTDDVVRERLAHSTQRRRELVRGWIEEAVASEELMAIPPNALASILLALTDGLMLHRALDPGGFRWANIRRAIDVLLAGIEA